MTHYPLLLITQLTSQIGKQITSPVAFLTDYIFMPSFNPLGQAVAIVLDDRRGLSGVGGKQVSPR
jgi:hypothetical protein